MPPKVAKMSPKTSTVLTESNNSASHKCVMCELVLLTKSVGFLTIQFNVKMKVPRDDFIFEIGVTKEKTEVN